VPIDGGKNIRDARRSLSNRRTTAQARKTRLILLKQQLRIYVRRRSAALAVDALPIIEVRRSGHAEAAAA